MRTCSNLFLLMVLLLGVLPAFAQSPGENSITIQKNTSSTNCVSEHSYYDGLGRLVEKVSVNLSPESGVDLLESTSYDAFGHILQKGKPIALPGNSGNYTDVTREHYISDYHEPYAYLYSYDEFHRCASKKLPGADAVTLQYDSMDRPIFLQSGVQKASGYNVREWPTDITSTNFRESLSYYDGKNREFGGNISAMTWSANDESLKRKYDFSYDRLSRLTSASYSEDNSTNAHYDTRYTYDLTGNSENIEYGYDKNGNLIKDLNKGILQIAYNSLNLPTTIKMEGGKSISYVYDAQGKKLQASYVTTMPSSSMTLDYCDNMIYENGKLTQILVDGGYISFTNSEPVYHYYLKDHLGSNRVVVNQATGEVEQVNHYYPFGGLMAESTGGNGQRYKYNGKELDRMHGLDWYDYGARWYAGMRFLTQDSKLEKYYTISPYVYCLNSPIRLFDNDGREPGDFFLSPDAAAKDFGLFYNANSIRDNLEYASSIYMIRNDKGTLGYTYTIAAKGKEHESVPSKPLPGFCIVASIHSHGAYDSRYKDNEFSGTYLYRDGKEVRIESLKTSKKGDIGNANLNKINAYLVTPNGSLQKYDYKTGKIKLLSTDMPSDNKDPSRLNEQSALVYDNRLDIEKLLELYRKQMYKFENIFKR